MSARTLATALGISAAIGGGIYVQRRASTPQPQLVIRARVVTGGALDFASIKLQNAPQPYLIVRSGGLQGFQAETTAPVTWTVTAGTLIAPGSLVTYQAPILLTGQQRVTLQATAPGYSPGNYYILVVAP